MGGGAWSAAVHEVTKSRARLSDFTFTFHIHALEEEMAPTPVFLPGESQGRGSLVGCRLWGHTESDTTEATWQRQQQQRAGHFGGVPWNCQQGLRMSTQHGPFLSTGLVVSLLTDEQHFTV